MIDIKVRELRTRVNRGLQCPECYGVQVSMPYRFLTKEQPNSNFQCEECGCNWDCEYYGQMQ